MTRDETKALLIKQGTLMCEARVQGWDAEQAIARAQAELADAADRWAVAASDLIEHDPDEGVGELTADEQYECFETACHWAGVSPEHPAFADELATFEIMRAQERSGTPELN